MLEDGAEAPEPPVGVRAIAALFACLSRHHKLQCVLQYPALVRAAPCLCGDPVVRWRADEGDHFVEEAAVGDHSTLFIYSLSFERNVAVPAFKERFGRLFRIIVHDHLLVPDGEDNLLSGRLLIDVHAAVCL